MTVTTVSIERKYSLGNYQMLTLSLTAELHDDTMTPEQALLRLLSDADTTARIYQNEPQEPR